MKKERILAPHPGGRYGLGDWHTHLPVLAATLFQMKPKRILELGIGDYSTMMFHAYAKANPDATVWSMENDFHPGWLAGLTWMESENHHIIKVDGWGIEDHNNDGIDLVFIDQGPEPDRIPSLAWAQRHGVTAIIHDCNYPERYGAILEGFDYVLHDRTHRFHTTVASTKHDVTTWL